jgi:hypothetical protein
MRGTAGQFGGERSSTETRCRFGSGTTSSRLRQSEPAAGGSSCSHIIPNIMGTVVVATTFSVTDAILLLAALSYLGLGPPPPAANW